MRHHARDRLLDSLCRAVAVGAVLLLAVIILLLLASGASVIGIGFLTRSWQHQDIAAGGIAQAIVGSAVIGLGVLALSLPLGLGTAVFLTEYSRESWLNRLIQLAIRNLAGVPSVVIGLFGLAVFVHALRFGPSLLAAVCTLSVMTLPWVITASVEALEAVPMRLRDSSLALGATRWQTVWRAVLPSAVHGCLTGGIVGMARAMGETAPIILVGATFYLTGFPTGPTDRFMALPYHTFILATQHADPLARAYAAGTALVLMLLTVALSSAAIVLRWRLRRRVV